MNVHSIILDVRYRKGIKKEALLALSMHPMAMSPIQIPNSKIHNTEL